MRPGSFSAITRLAERIDALSLRERAMVFSGVLLAPIFIAANLLFAPLRNEQNRLEAQVTARIAQVRQLNAEANALIGARLADPDAQNRAKLAALQEELTANKGRLANVTQGLVDPKEMARLVRTMLAKNGALQLVSLVNLPPQPLDLDDQDGKAKNALPTVNGKAAQGAAASDTMLYRHGMRIELRGRYVDIVRYLRTLEGLPWKVLWGEVDLKAEKYPVSDVTLVIYTLGFNRAWIGT